MSGPQKENGYTSIANEIIEVMARTKLNATQYRILFVVWRYTYGFNRKEHELSLSFLSIATGCDKRQLQRELKNLEDKKIIIQNIKNGIYRKVQFNKHYRQWVGEPTIGESVNGERDNGETINPTIGESVKATIGESDNQERKTKEKYKEIYSQESNEVILSELLFQKMRINNPKCKGPDMQKWAEHIDKLIRIDGQSAEDIKAVIVWCQEDSFWKSNILGTEKLRKKFDQLLIKCKTQVEVKKEKEYKNPYRMVD